MHEKSPILKKVLQEMRKVMVGQDYLLERMLIGLIANGHILVEGVPGLAKTTAVKTLAQTIHTSFQRIQFTPDLLPADLIGSAPSLADRFRPAPDQRAPDSFAAHFEVTRRGRREDAMRLIAPVTVRAPLAGFSGRCALKLLAAPAFNIGDGVQLDMSLEIAGRRETVYRRYFDAARRTEDRKWIPIEFFLDLPEGIGSFLSIQVSGGAQGDLTADWLALAGLTVSCGGKVP